MQLEITPEISYVLLLFSLFVIPRFLQRYRLPAAVTSLALGALAGPGLGLFQHDATVNLLSTLGIVALFLFAGLDVEVDALKKHRGTLLEHLAVTVLGLLGVGLGAHYAFGLDARASLLLALALFTPSAGFILDSLPSLGIDARASFWVRGMAIATELVALTAMFLILQSASTRGLLTSSGVLIAMILLLPIVFRGFARFIVPHAPKTEFAFLLMTAVVCAAITRRLGVYYLVGAFVVGMVAQGFRERLPAMASERMLHAVEAFASIFVPFYFFHAGLILSRGDFTWAALAHGAAFVVLALPARVALVALHRRIRFKEGLRESVQVGVPLLPTLVFTLVIAQILRARFDVPAPVFGGLIIYALANTVIPSLVFRTPTPEFESPEAPSLPGAAG